MIYHQFTGTLLQDKLTRNEEYVTKYDLNTPEKLKPVKSPLISDNTIVFIGQKSHGKKTFTFNKTGVSRSKRTACLMPMFNTPTFTILSSRKRERIKNEFFFKPPNCEDELIVYQLQSSTKDHIEFAFFKTNGEYVSSINHQVKGVTNYEDFKLKVSPNGKL